MGEITEMLKISFVIGNLKDRLLFDSWEIMLRNCDMISWTDNALYLLMRDLYLSLDCLVCSDSDQIEQFKVSLCLESVIFESDLVTFLF